MSDGDTGYHKGRNGFCPRCGREITADRIKHIYTHYGMVKCGCGQDIVCAPYRSNILWDSDKAEKLRVYVREADEVNSLQNRNAGLYDRLFNRREHESDMDKIRMNRDSNPDSKFGILGRFLNKSSSDEFNNLDSSGLFENLMNLEAKIRDMLMTGMCPKEVKKILENALRLTKKAVEVLDSDNPDRLTIASVNYEKANELFFKAEEKRSELGRVFKDGASSHILNNSMARGTEDRRIYSSLHDLRGEISRFEISGVKSKDVGKLLRKSYEYCNKGVESLNSSSENRLQNAESYHSKAFELYEKARNLNAIPTGEGSSEPILDESYLLGILSSLSEEIKAEYEDTNREKLRDGGYKVKSIEKKARKLASAKSYCDRGIRALESGDDNRAKIANKYYVKALKSYEEAQGLEISEADKFKERHHDVTAAVMGGSAFENKYAEYVRNVDVNIANLKNKLKDKDEEIESKEKKLKQLNDEGVLNGVYDHNEIERLKKEIDKIENEDKKHIEERLKRSNSIWDDLKKKRDSNLQSHDKVASYIKAQIHNGSSPELAVWKAADKYGLDEGVVREELGHYAGLEDQHRTNEGHKFFGKVKIPVLSGMKNRGRERNIRSTDSLLEDRRNAVERQNDLKEKLKGLDESDPEYKKAKDQLDQVDKEIDEIDKEIKLFDEHPELLKRSWFKIGRAGRNAGKGLRNKRQEIGSGIRNAWSSSKAKAVDILQMLLPLAVFVVLLYMAVFHYESSYFPINLNQAVIFILITLAAGAVKYSMTEDEGAEDEAREIVAFLVIIGTLIAIAINFSWTGFIFCIFLGLFVFFDYLTDSLVFSFIMFVLMLFLLYFTMTGWLNIIGIQVENVAMQTGFGEAVDTSLRALGDAWSDIWLMVTNPNGWYAKQQAEAAAQKDEGETNRALELTTTQITPSVINRGDDANVIVGVENYATEDLTKYARDAVIFVRKKGDLSGYITLETLGDLDERYVGDLLAGTTAQEIFEIETYASCSGTFNIEAGVHYEYSAVSTGSVFVIGVDRYDELIKQGKFVPVRQETKSSSGPVSVSVLTNIPQPIPVVDSKEFSLHFSFLNLRSGEGMANLRDVDITLPEEFQIKVGGRCGLCKLPDPNHYSISGMYAGEPEGVPCTVLSGDGFNISSDMRSVKCDMEYLYLDDVYFEKPLYFQVDIPTYGFKYARALSFTTMWNDLDNPPIVCT